MNTQSSNFKQEAEKIRVHPPRSAWIRIKAQLDADGSRRKIKIARLINYAAAVILIIVFASLGLYFSTLTSWNDSNLYSSSLEPLSLDVPASASIYDIEKVKDLTAYFASK
jgi:hypothetical protein